MGKKSITSDAHAESGQEFWIYAQIIGRESWATKLIQEDPTRSARNLWLHNHYANSHVPGLGLHPGSTMPGLQSIDRKTNIVSHSRPSLSKNLSGASMELDQIDEKHSLKRGSLNRQKKSVEFHCSIWAMVHSAPFRIFFKHDNHDHAHAKQW